MLCDRCKHEIESIPYVEDPASFVEKLDLNSLSSLPVERYEELPRTAAVYFALSPTAICYIGQSMDLVRRWRTHEQLTRLRQVGGRIAWVEIREEQLRALEKAAIAYFKPVWNEEATALKLARWRLANSKGYRR